MPRSLAVIAVKMNRVMNDLLFCCYAGTFFFLFNLMLLIQYLNERWLLAINSSSCLCYCGMWMLCVCTSQKEKSLKLDPTITWFQASSGGENPQKTWMGWVRMCSLLLKLLLCPSTIKPSMPCIQAEPNLHTTSALLLFTRTLLNVTQTHASWC